MSQRGDIVMTKCGYSMSYSRRPRVVSSFYGDVFSQPRLLMTGEMFLFPVLFPNPVRMGGEIVEFSGSGMIFVVRSVVVTRRHGYFRLSIWFDLECACFDSW